MPQDVSLGEPTPPPGPPYDGPHQANGARSTELSRRQIQGPPRILMVVVLALTISRTVSHLRDGEHWLAAAAAATLVTLTYFGTRSMEFYEWAARRSWRNRRNEVGVLAVGLVGAIALSASVGGPARLAPPAVMLAFCWFSERAFRARPAPSA